MQKIINVMEVMFGLLAALWCSLYYLGKLNYKGEKEKRREERVRKYKYVFILAISLLLFSSVYLLILTLS